MPASLSPIADRLFHVRPDGRTVLLGGRNRSDGRLSFPLPPADDERIDPVELGDRGTLWSYTIQRFRPKSPPYAGPEIFEPYAVGYVDLEQTIIVEGRLVGVPFDALRIGMGLRLVTQPFLLASGETRLTYAFAQEASA